MLEEIIKFLKEHPREYTRRQVALKFGVNYNTMRRKLPSEMESYFITRNSKSKEAFAVIEPLVRDNPGIYTKKEICDRFNIGIQTLNNWSRIKSLTFKREPTKGKRESEANEKPMVIDWDKLETILYSTIEKTDKLIKHKEMMCQFGHRKFLWEEDGKKFMISVDK